MEVVTEGDKIHGKGLLLISNRKISQLKCGLTVGYTGVYERTGL